MVKIQVNSQGKAYYTSIGKVLLAPEGGSGGIPREVKNGMYQMPTESFTFSLPSDATDVVANCLSSAFQNCTGLTSVDLSSLTTISGENSLYYAFSGCTSLTNVDLSSLTTVSGRECLSSAFRNCTSLTNVDLSALTTISGDSGLSDAFRNCTSLTSVDLSALTTLNYRGLSYAFQYCTELTDIYFRALTTSSFGSYVNQFGSMMYGTGTSKTHIIHFPSNMESTISGLDGYPLFGGTTGYVVLAFDLPATE